MTDQAPTLPRKRIGRPRRVSPVVRAHALLPPPMALELDAIAETLQSSRCELIRRAVQAYVRPGGEGAVLAAAVVAQAKREADRRSALLASMPRKPKKG